MGRKNTGQLNSHDQTLGGSDINTQAIARKAGATASPSTPGPSHLQGKGLMHFPLRAVLFFLTE